MDSSYSVQMENLEQVFGPANASGFGSAVFREAVNPPIVLDSIALNHFKKFLGKKLTPQTERTWMDGFRRVYSRGKDVKADILRELSSIGDSDAKSSIPLLTELIQNAEQGRSALSGAFNHPDVQDLSAYKLSDGEAMSGIMITATYKNGLACSVIALMD